MSQWEKLLLKIKNLSGGLRFAELKKVLESYGYEMQTPSGGSSHYTFRKAGSKSVTIPRQAPVKKDYVKLVKEIVESEEENNG
ncbi:MAG: hypothetical protein IJR21_05005 [Synergistaceae bacterium]|nr:hypothetical protein [Synergistaceae bacterium]